MITAGPVIGTLAEVAAEGRVDLRGVVDRTQMSEVFRQWRENPRSAWKVPIVGSFLAPPTFAASLHAATRPRALTTSCTPR